MLGADRAEARFRRTGVLLGLGHLASQSQCPSLVGCQFPIGSHALIWQCIQPTAHGRQAAAAEGLVRRQPDQPLGILYLAGCRCCRRCGCQRVLDRLTQAPVVLVPVGRPLVQPLLLVRIECCTQKLGKKPVVMVPLASMVERSQEDVCCFQLFEHQVAVLSPRHCIAKRGGQPVQDRRLAQEVANRLRLPLDHLGHQVVHDVAVITGEGSDEGFGLRWILLQGQCLQGQGCQLQAGDPAFGAGFERRHYPAGEAQTHRLVQENGCLLARETQVALPDLGHLASGTQPWQGERWVLASADDQVHRGRLAFKQGLNDPVHCRGSDEVVVVQHQQEGCVHGGDVVDQRRDQAVGRGRLRGAEDGLDRLADAAIDLLKCSDEVVQELSGVVVSLVQREPGEVRSREERRGSRE